MPVVGIVLLVAATAVGCGLVLSGYPSTRAAAMFIAGLTLLWVLGADLVVQMWRRMRFREPVSVGTSGHSSRGHVLESAESCWNSATTVWLGAIVLVPGLIALTMLRPVVSSLHPVAVLLTSLIGAMRPMTPGLVLGTALLAGTLPVALTLAASVWGLLRNIRPLPAALLALHRASLPLVAGLAVSYILLLTYTLRVDAEVSRDINEAARNDLQWVLTHSTPGT